ncbi:MAG: hypothetical protein ACYS1A_17765, partial [Planctomycetota bacterium]
GYGDGVIITIPKSKAWIGYHYIQKTDGKYILRNGKAIKVKEICHEKEIKMCKYGLHAGLSKNNAKKYAPINSVLTKVAIFGKIIVGNDKLVATDRYIIEEV